MERLGFVCQPHGFQLERGGHHVAHRVGQVEVPVAAYGKVPEDTTGRMVITVTKDEKLFIGSIPVTFDQLTQRIQLEFEANPKLRLLIRADGDVKYKVNQEITVACAEIGARDLIYSVFEE